MTRLYMKLFDLLKTRLRQIGNDFETCNSEIAAAELEGRMAEIDVMLKWLRSQVVNRFNARMAKARAQGVLH